MGQDDDNFEEPIQQLEAKIAAFAKAVSENRDKAKTLDELKIALPPVNNTCNDCHELYRRPQ